MSQIAVTSALVALSLLLLAGVLLVLVMLFLPRRRQKRELELLTQWCAGQGWGGRPGQLPDFLQPVGLTSFRTEISLARGADTFVQIFSATTPRSSQPGKPTHWRLLIRNRSAAGIQNDQPAVPGVARPHSSLHFIMAGLRPTRRPVCILDLFDLGSFPSLNEDNRFMLFGNDKAAVQALIKSAAARRLPSDLGLLLTHQYLILDFTARKFSPEIFGQILALADEIGDSFSRPVPLQ